MSQQILLKPESLCTFMNIHAHAHLCQNLWLKNYAIFNGSRKFEVGSVLSKVLKTMSNISSCIFF